MKTLPTQLATPMLALPRSAKRLLAVLVDMGLCVLTVWLAYYLRLGEFVTLFGQALWAVGVSIAFALPIFVVSGLYRAIFRYSGWPALLTVARAVGIYGLLYAALFTAFGVPGVPRTIGIIQPILLLLFVGISRLLVRFWLGDEYQRLLQRAARPAVLIYGAGTSGRQLVQAMLHSHEMQVVGFVDDDEGLQRQTLNGLPIHAPARLAHVIETKGVKAVLLAMPRLSRQRRNEILEHLRPVQVEVRTLPSLHDLAQGKISISDLRELDIDDLLGREPVLPDQGLLAKNISAKVVLVTGAGGSIGSELCRQILELSPRVLLLVELSEFALYSIHQELEGRLAGRETRLVPLLASVQDEARMEEILASWHPHSLYHAAAYKHVPMVEHNVAAGIRNNVLGTLRTAQVAMRQGVMNFVLISTDKAVRPTNIMGASKRLAEMLLQALAAHAYALTPDPSPGGRGEKIESSISERQGEKTRFSMVRFGNVLGSSGSVVPKFRQQIRDGGPITLTHPDITRYFMTIPEAAQLVIQAGAMAEGGDVFVLDMGQSFRIIDLARRMVELSGLLVRDQEHPDGDIEIQITGLRPGEKLYEELLIGENPKPTPHPRIMQAHETFIPWGELVSDLHTLEQALDANAIEQVRLLLQRLVSGYAPAGGVVDWLYCEQEARSLSGSGLGKVG